MEMYKEGVTIFSREAHRFAVETSVVTGKIQMVGWVWSVPDHSVAGKNAKTPRKVWMARYLRGGEVGPYQTRKAAAKALT